MQAQTPNAPVRARERTVRLAVSRIPIEARTLQWPAAGGRRPKEDMSMSANTTHGHVREHGSLLAQVEKRTLVRIAERLPRAINSDHLSALGLAGMALAGGA